MAEIWYKDAVTNAPIYQVHLEKQRHFTLEKPLPGGLTLCGLTLGDDWKQFDSIETTHETCSSLAMKMKLPDAPGPKQSPSIPIPAEQLEALRLKFLQSLDEATTAVNAKDSTYEYTSFESSFFDYKQAIAQSSNATLVTAARVQKQ